MIPSPDSPATDGNFAPYRFAGATTPGSIAGAVGRTISTRFPEALKATEDALTDHGLIINSEVAG